MCSKGPLTLTLFIDESNENWYPIQGPNPERCVTLQTTIRHGKTQSLYNRFANTLNLTDRFFSAYLGVYAPLFYSIQFMHPKDHTEKAMPKRAKMIPYWRIENLKNHTLSRSTYLYSPYIEAPSPSDQLFTEAESWGNNWSARHPQITKFCDNRASSITVLSFDHQFFLLI